jgi:hypothetical protein
VFFRSFFIAALLLISVAAWAQETVISAPPPPTSATSTYKTTLPWQPPLPGKISEVYDYTFRSNISNGPGNPDAAPPSSLGRTLRSQTQSHVFGLRYSISEKWGARLVGAAVDNNLTILKKDGTEENVFIQGMGDMKAQAVYSIYQAGTHRFEASGGTTIPTGATDLIGPNGKPLSSRNQLGSGTFDLVPGVSYTFTKGGWELGNRIEAVLHTGKNSSGYTNGDEFTETISANYLVFPFLAPSLQFNLKNRQRKTTDHPEFGSSSSSVNQRQRRDQTTGDVLPGPSSPQDSFGGPGWSFGATAALRSRLPLGKSSPVKASVEVGIPVYSTGASDTGMKTEWFAGTSLTSNF